MTGYPLSRIAEVTNGIILGEKSELTVSQLILDSRNAYSADGSLFVAIKGKQHDGHRFIHELYQRGVRAFVISDPGYGLSTYTGACFIKVKDTLKALQDIARYHRARFNCMVAAITGSNGKTIIKEWLCHCLEDHITVTRSPKSYNSQVGVPLSLWLMDEHTGLGIFEAGISAPGEMNSLRLMIRPDIGLFTNIGEAHQENFTSIEQKIGEKLQLFHGCHTLVFCSDHETIRKCIEKTPELSGVNLFTWSARTKADLQVAGVTRENGSTFIRTFYRKSGMDFRIPFADDASLENALHCLAFMLASGIRPDNITEKMATLPPVAMRLEQKSAINECTLINDSYNSDINSLSIALDLLNRQVQHMKKTLILSDILQSGKKNDELYPMVSRLLKEKGITRIIGIGDAITSSSKAFSIPGEFHRTTESFIRDFTPEMFRDEAILLKGARQFEFEKISALLEQKKHTTRVEINLDALTKNLNYYRSLLEPGTKMMVMVKAQSYGSGRHEIASFLQYQRVDYLGVAFADEGVNLRQSGISIPIMVMSPEPESFETMIRHRLEPELYSFRILKMFRQAVTRSQEINYPVHLKLDTGMHRLGFLETEIPDLCKELVLTKNLKVQTIFSHLAGSDEDTFDDFSKFQIEIFKRACQKIGQTLGYKVARHILNTSGIERFPGAQFEMVRLGIGLFGISQVNPEKLCNVSTLKSTISQIKELTAGETVGYSRKGKLSKSSFIAVIPIGYADGLNRRLSNGKGSLFVNGKLAPIVGNICMDMTMIDVSDVEAKEGDEVVVFGDDNPIQEMARQLGTIPYEILTGISDRVKRVYIHE
jgi:alanine racemase